jgi:hypothetical protein
MVFRSKTFKNRAARRKNRKTVRRTKGKQRGGYVPYRRDPPGGVSADLIDWDDQKELVEAA